MIKTLAKSIREYKKPSILAPVFVSGEVVLECIIPFITANLVNEIKNGCSIEVLLRYGAILVVMAGLSVRWRARPVLRQAAALRATYGRICFIKYRGTLLRTSINFLFPALLRG